MILCSGERAECWFKIEKFGPHFMSHHRDSAQKLLAGRGCAGCNKTVPVARLHLHLSCMNQTPDPQVPPQCPGIPPFAHLLLHNSPSKTAKQQNSKTAKQQNTANSLESLPNPDNLIENPGLGSQRLESTFIV